MSKEKEPEMRQLTSMSVDKLLTLREAINRELQQRQDKIQKDLQTLSGSLSAGNHKSNGNRLKGKKVKPKYRGPNGETWAGRGMKPKWLTALVKQGRKLESYRIKA
jgi:DNA-binding protein H-NS